MAGEFKWDLANLRENVSYGDLRMLISENWEVFGPSINTLQYLLGWTPFNLDGTRKMGILGF